MPGPLCYANRTSISSPTVDHVPLPLEDGSPDLDCVLALTEQSTGVEEDDTSGTLPLNSRTDSPPPPSYQEVMGGGVCGTTADLSTCSYTCGTIFLNGAELLLNSVNSGNLVNHPCMNKGPVALWCRLK